MNDKKEKISVESNMKIKEIKKNIDICTSEMNDIIIVLNARIISYLKKENKDYNIINLLEHDENEILHSLGKKDITLKIDILPNLNIKAVFSNAKYYWSDIIAQVEMMKSKSGYDIKIDSNDVGHRSEDNFGNKISIIDVSRIKAACIKVAADCAEFIQYSPKLISGLLSDYSNLQNNKKDLMKEITILKNAAIDKFITTNKQKIDSILEIPTEELVNNLLEEVRNYPEKTFDISMSFVLDSVSDEVSFYHSKVRKNFNSFEIKLSNKNHYKEITPDDLKELLLKDSFSLDGKMLTVNDMKKLGSPVSNLNNKEISNFKLSDMLNKSRSDDLINKASLLRPKSPNKI
jgi:hypothetical protein